MKSDSGQAYDSRSPFARHVAEWKLDVHSFFCDDWSRLRSLIQELEDESWGNDKALNSSDRHSTNAELLSAEYSDFSSGSSESRGATDEVAVLAADRLAELSEKIVRRMQIANGRQG